MLLTRIKLLVRNYFVDYKSVTHSQLLLLVQLLRTRPYDLFQFRIRPPSEITK
jgi:hypothetical protein